MKKQNVLKRLGALGVTMCLLVGSLVGCGNTDPKSESSSAGSKVSEESKSSEESKVTEENKEVVELILVGLGTEPAEGYDALYEALDALTIPELGVKVRIQTLAWGEEGTKIPLAVAGGEADMIINGPWASFLDYAGKNAFLDVAPYLETYPDLVDLYDETVGTGFLESQKIDGKLFGFNQITNKKAVDGNGMLYRQDLIDEWGLKDITDFASLEAYLYTAKDNGYQYITMDSRISFFVWEMMYKDEYKNLTASGNFNGLNYIVAPIDDPYNPMYIWETEEFENVCKIVEKWYNDGIIKSDVLSASIVDGHILFSEDVVPAEICGTVNGFVSSYSVAALTAHPEWKLDFIPYHMLEDNKDYPWGLVLPSVGNETLITISALSEHPDESMAFIHKALTDERYARLMNYGVEGVHYTVENGVATKNPDNKMGLSTGFANYQHNYDKSYVNDEFKATYEKRDAEFLKKMNEGGVIENPYMGFKFDKTTVEAEFANMENVESEYAIPLMCGVLQSSVEKDLETLKSMMDKAGAAEYMAEFQKQLSAFAANK